MTDASATLAGGEGRGLPRGVGRTAERGAIGADFRRDGGGETVVLPDALRASATRRLRERVGIARDLAKDEARLGTYDRLLLGERGEELVAKFDSGHDLTAEDMSLAWAVVSDELIQKEDAVGNAYSRSDWLIRLNDRLEASQRALGVLGNTGARRALDRLAVRVHRVITSDRFDRFNGGRGASKVEVNPTGAPELTSDYIQKLRYTDMPADRVLEDITDLHRLKVSFEQSLGIPDVDPDIWRQPDFQRGAGHRLHDTVADRQDRILAREHNGMTFAELQRADPVGAERVRHQAVQEGLMHFSDGMARELLKAERPDVDTAGIDAAIDSIGTPLTGIAREQAERNRDRAVNRWQQAMNNFDQLEDSRPGRLQAIADARTASAQAVAEDTALQAQLNQEITNIYTPRLNALQAQQLGMVPGSNPHTNIQTQIDAVDREINSRLQRLNTSATRVLQTAQAINDAQDSYDLLDAAVNVPGSLLHAEAAIDAARVARENFDNQLRGTPDAEQRATRGALERWRVLADPANYDRIMDTRFTQGHQGRYQRGRLADVTVAPGPDGQMVGAELIREHIFAVTDAANGYRTEEQRERGRRMISDEAIARSIIEVFRVDVGTEMQYPAGTTRTYADMLRRIGTRRTNLNTVLANFNASPPTATQAQVDTARRRLQRNEQALLGQLLPIIRDATNFDAGDVLRFVVHEGLLSAARGEPYLAVPTEYEAQQPERRLTAEAILGQNMGGVTIIEGTRLESPVVAWEGPMAHIYTAGGIFDGFAIPADRTLNMRIRTNFRNGVLTTRGEAECRVEVETDENFLQSLPNVAPPNCPQEILAQFYDLTGRLRTRTPRLVESIPRWIEVYAPNLPAGPATADIVGPVNAYLSPDASRSVNVATANEILSRPPQERQRIVRGFRDTGIAGLGITATVSMDNQGEFWINVAGLGMQQLGGYFEDQRDQYAQANPAMQATIQNRLLLLQQQVGREIMRTQARR